MTDITTNGKPCNCTPVHNIDRGWHEYKCDHHGASARDENTARRDYENIRAVFNDYKCISDGGNCGVGGYCDECPYRQ